MDIEEFRENGKRVIDFIADFLHQIKYMVSSIKHHSIKNTINCIFNIFKKPNDWIANGLK